MQRKRAGWRKWAAIHACFAACIVAAAALLSAAFWWQARDRLLAACYEKQLATQSGDELGILRVLVSLRRPGIAVVVRVMGSPLPATRDAANRVLDDELSRWEASPSDETTVQRLSDLAQALADNTDGFPPAVRQRAEKLAVRIISLSDKAPLRDRVELLASCQRLLSIGDPFPTPPRIHRTPLAMTPHARQHKPNEPPPPPSDHLVVSSSGLDLDQLAAPTLARADAPGRISHAEPRTLTANDAAALVATKEPTSVQPRAANQADRVKLAGYTRNTQQEEDQDAILAARQKGRDQDVMELFAQLHEQGPIAAAARLELDLRGYSPRQIEVAQHLVSHDATERLQWAERLPGIRGIDARFWLLRLSQDPNRQVRRAAVGLLATDRDPEVVRRLQQIAIAETDDRIRDEASRALEVLSEP